MDAVLDERDPSKLRIDIRVHPIGGRSFGAEAAEIQRAYREGFRDGLQEAEFKRWAIGSNPRPKRRGFLGRALTFVVCAGLGAVATIALTAYHPRPSAIASLDELGSQAASPGSQSRAVPAPSEPAPEWVGPAGSAEKEPGPGIFGLHQQ